MSLEEKLKEGKSQGEINREILILLWWVQCGNTHLICKKIQVIFTYIIHNNIPQYKARSIAWASPVKSQNKTKQKQKVRMQFPNISIFLNKRQYGLGKKTFPYVWARYFLKWINCLPSCKNLYLWKWRSWS